MNPSVTAIAALAFLASSCSAFVVPQVFQVSSRLNVSLRMAVELEPEPEGGEEVKQIDTMTGSRMKNMGPEDGVKSENGSQVYSFWMTAEADGTLIKEIRTKVQKDASKKANFPGFRKVSFSVS